MEVRDGNLRIEVIGERKKSLFMAIVADNVSYESTLQDKKFSETDEERRTPKVPRVKIRLLDEEGDNIPTGFYAWAYLNHFSSGQRDESSLAQILSKGTYVDVFRDKKSGLYYIDRVSPSFISNHLTHPLVPREPNGTQSGYGPDDKAPTTAFNMGWQNNNYPGPRNSLKDNVEAVNRTGPSNQDSKENAAAEVLVSINTFCSTKKGKSNLVGIGKGIESLITGIDRQKERLQNLNDTLVGPARQVNIRGTSGTDDEGRDFDDPEAGTRTIPNLQDRVLGQQIFGVSLDNAQDQLDVFENLLNRQAKNVADFVNGLINGVEERLIALLNKTWNKTKGLVPKAGQKTANSIVRFLTENMACIFNIVRRNLYFLVRNALKTITKNITTVVSCFITKFVSNFIGQIFGQLSALVGSLINTVKGIFSTISGGILAGVNFLNSITDVLESLLSFLKCEFEKCESDEPLEWNLINGGKSQKLKFDINAIFENAKNVGEKFRDITNIPENIEDFNFNLDVDDFLNNAVDDTLQECNTGPLVCGVPNVIFWGGVGSGAAGNAIVSAAGDLLSVDIVLPGEYESAPFIDFDDPCGRGQGGAGTVVVDDTVGIGTTFGDGTIGIGTTGGIGIGGTDLVGGQFGTGDGLGIGVTFIVTVKRTDAGNKYVIDGRQQREITFTRGNTYIFDQQDETNNTHQLRFSETKNGTWGGGVEYTRGVTIDGIPGLEGAYSRIIANNNTPDTLYYYCINHSAMGAKINVINPEVTTLDQSGRNATVEIDEVDNQGGVVALKNLNGGSGYVEGSTNVTTRDGDGSGFTVDITSASAGIISLLTINNKGLGYSAGDIVTILSRSATPQPTRTVRGVTDVIITESGRGYLPRPDGSVGGNNRTWANKCQTVVHRGDGEWNKYREGELIFLFPGDCVRLPGKPEICIDDDFDTNLLPGSTVIGDDRDLNDMSNFPIADDANDENKKAIDFSNIKIIDPPGEIFDWPRYGVKRNDTREVGTDNLADWEFRFNDELIGVFSQTSITQVPQLYVNDVLYRIGNSREFSIPDPILQQTPWVRAADNLPDGVKDLWSPFMKNYAVYPSNTEALLGAHTAIWEIDATLGGKYQVEFQSDNKATVSWDGIELAQTTEFQSHNVSIFAAYAGDVEPGIHQLTVTIENLPHKDPEKLATTNLWDFNPAGVAFVVRNPYGQIIKTSLDTYGSIFKRQTESFWSIIPYNVIDNGNQNLGANWFGYLKDYFRAKFLGYTDRDIRNFLESNINGLGLNLDLDQRMKNLLDDDNWGKISNYKIQLTAPGCPPEPDLPVNTYPLICSLEKIIITDDGFGYDPFNDTVQITPSNGAKAVISRSDGRIQEITVTKGGAGFTELPTVTINTRTGLNATLLPVLKCRRPEDIDAPEGTSVVQVVDCVGNVGPAARTEVR